jgi:hypothetical protein
MAATLEEHSIKFHYETPGKALGKPVALSPEQDSMPMFHETPARPAAAPAAAAAPRAELPAVSEASRVSRRQSMSADNVTDMASFLAAVQAESSLMDFDAGSSFDAGNSVAEPGAQPPQQVAAPAPAPAAAAQPAMVGSLAPPCSSLLTVSLPA